MKRVTRIVYAPALKKGERFKARSGEVWIMMRNRIMKRQDELQLGDQVGEDSVVVQITYSEVADAKPVTPVWPT